ncbi:MAG: transposase [Trichodesmium erythraeum GBRTRLIN201]|nr:transposase [Trichodesmium erythraeum GBRTRLIN201]
MIAGRFYPSSQICSHCGYKQKMLLHKRTYECDNCGLKADRDFNAAIKSKNYVNK